MRDSPLAFNGSFSTSDWPTQELLDVPEALPFTSDIPNAATHYHHHDAYGLPVEHLTLWAQTFGHDTAMDIPDSLGLPAGRMILGTQTFGRDTTMDITQNQDHLFSANNGVSGWSPNTGMGTATAPSTSSAQRTQSVSVPRPTRTIPAAPLQQVAQTSPDLAWLDTCIYGVLAALLFMVVKKFV